MNLVKKIKVSEKIEEIHRIKKKLNVYKMFEISATTFAKNKVYSIIDEKKVVAKK